MGQIRRSTLMDKKAFPGATFAVNDTPPIAQCEETAIVVSAASITLGLPFLTKVGAFAGIDLTGKRLEVFFPPAGAGVFTILSNTDDVLTASSNMTATHAAANATVQDFAGFYLTRSESSFTRHIERLNKAHTVKGGQLFTDTASPPMAGACSITFNPD